MAILKEFSCARCGQCCANQDVIQLTSYELYRLADHLGCPPAELYERHCTIAETSLNVRKHMYIRTTDGRCPFLDGSLCGVHTARPFACRAYPMRVPESTAGDMKRFVLLKYPMLERTCSLFRLDNDDVLNGDIELLVNQTIAFATDEIYFNMIADEAVDLSIPSRVAAGFMNDTAARTEATEFLLSAGKTPMLRSIGRMAMALQAAVWGTNITFVREPSRVTLEHAVKPGNYVLASTDRAIRRRREIPGTEPEPVLQSLLHDIGARQAPGERRLRLAGTQPGRRLPARAGGRVHQRDDLERCDAAVCLFHSRRRRGRAGCGTDAECRPALIIIVSRRGSGTGTAPSCSRACAYTPG